MSGALAHQARGSGAMPRRGYRQAAGPGTGARSFVSGLKTAYFGSALYRLTLGGRVPDSLDFDPADPYPGEALRGDALFQGRFSFAGYDIVAPNRPLWEPVGAPPPWIEEMHAFGWLRHFRANGGETARRHARALVGDWISHYGTWHPVMWRPDILGYRIASWLQNAAFLLNGGDESFRTMFFDCLARQARHLGRTGVENVAGARRIAALKGMLYACVCLPRGEKRLDAVLKRLDTELRRQILADGGHVERSPAVQAMVLADLAETRKLLLDANRLPSEALISAIDRMAPMLRTFRHGDGGLALFNGATEMSAESVEQVLTLADARGRALSGAPHSGFQRLSAGRTLVLVDAGVPPTLGDVAHAGTLSFEMSAGRQRLVVNCGAMPGGDAQWRRALAGTPAHSTLTIGDTDSAVFAEGGGALRRPGEVQCARNESEGDVWIDARHDGYLASHGAIHRRRLYLAAGGDDLRGEDSLISPERYRVTIRFHLHPDVQASQVRDGSTILLRPPGGMGWRFRTAGAEVTLTESVYFGAAGQRRRSEQILLTAEAGGDLPPLKWAFRKYPGGR